MRSENGGRSTCRLAGIVDEFALPDASGRHCHILVGRGFRTASAESAGTAWNAVFKPVFGRPEDVRESFQRLFPVRIATMHARLVCDARRPAPAPRRDAARAEGDRQPSLNARRRIGAERL